MRTIVRKIKLLTTIAFLGIAPGKSEATVLEFLDLESLTDISHLIVHAKVASVESDWNQEHTGIRTRITLEVKTVFRGTFDGERLSIELPGGAVPEENLRQVIPGIPRFEVGEEAILFLRNDADLMCPITGWIQGKFDIVTQPSTGEKLVLDRLGKARRYLERTRRGNNLRNVGGINSVTMEQFASVIAEIKGRKGSAK